MGKRFSSISFNLAQYEEELGLLGNLLQQPDAELKEQEQIQPYFKHCALVASQIATLVQLKRIDKITFEYELFGDFQCDLVIGDSQNHEWCFVEYEDASKKSIFDKSNPRFHAPFSSRFEHGMSQIIDWFYKLDCMQHSQDMEDRFGARTIRYHGILLIGRNAFISMSERERLRWRVEKTVINSSHIQCLTYDMLHLFLNERLQHIYQLKQ